MKITSFNRKVRVLREDFTNTGLQTGKSRYGLEGVSLPVNALYSFKNFMNIEKLQPVSCRDERLTVSVFQLVSTSKQQNSWYTDWPRN